MLNMLEMISENHLGWHLVTPTDYAKLIAKFHGRINDHTNDASIFFNFKKMIHLCFSTIKKNVYNFDI
jgi:hypothetical protein